MLRCSFPVLPFPRALTLIRIFILIFKLTLPRSLENEIFMWQIAGNGYAPKSTPVVPLCDLLIYRAHLRRACFLAEVTEDMIYGKSVSRQIPRESKPLFITVGKNTAIALIYVPLPVYRTSFPGCSGDENATNFSTSLFSCLSLLE